MESSRPPPAPDYGTPCLNPDHRPGTVHGVVPRIWLLLSQKRSQRPAALDLYARVFENYETLAALNNWTERQKKASLRESEPPEKS
ncbi:hypothetical protein EVAR_87947_1 [Eumeta japonica]|uniref:Uncharacterized protein n=1 Tax=Eumeta variegata TaxID=151549 RepID=A0A4C1VB58_EUMVA|nr:hypothetical protein EVAR_87947_1 [Eumeta japonica]